MHQGFAQIGAVLLEILQLFFYFFVIPMKFYALPSILPQINLCFLTGSSIEIVGYRFGEDLAFVVIEAVLCCFQVIFQF